MTDGTQILALVQEAIESAPSSSLKWVAGRMQGDRALVVVYSVANSAERWGVVISLDEVVADYPGNVSTEMVVGLIVDEIAEPSFAELRPEIELADDLVESPRLLLWRGLSRRDDSPAGQRPLKDDSDEPPTAIRYGTSWTPIT